MRISSLIHGIPELTSLRPFREGATIGCTKQLVEARAARATFGGCVRQLYDPKLHNMRKDSAYNDTEYVALGTRDEIF